MGKFCARICTTEESVSGGVADIGYTRDSPPRHAQTINLWENRDARREAPPPVGVMPTLPRLSDPGRKLKIIDARELGLTLVLGDASGPGWTLQLRDVSEPGGRLELGHMSGRRKADYFESAATTPIPVFEEKTSRHHLPVSSDREQIPRDSD